MAVKKKKGLGRGLDALIAPSVPQANHSTAPSISNDTSTLPTPSSEKAATSTETSTQPNVVEKIVEVPVEKIVEMPELPHSLERIFHINAVLLHKGGNGAGAGRAILQPTQQTGKNAAFNQDMQCRLPRSSAVNPLHILLPRYLLPFLPARISVVIAYALHGTPRMSSVPPFVQPKEYPCLPFPACSMGASLLLTVSHPSVQGTLSRPGFQYCEA